MCLASMSPGSNGVFVDQCTVAMLGANGICVQKQGVLSLDRTWSRKEVKFKTQTSIATIYLGFEEKDTYINFFPCSSTLGIRDKMTKIMRVKIA